VIAGDHHHGRVGLRGNARQEPIELSHGRRRRGSPVENISCNYKNINVAGGDRRNDLVENCCVIGIKRNPVELTPEMEVGGVENPHGNNLYIFYSYIF
jgi:hypothetical protein